VPHLAQRLLVGVAPGDALIEKSTNTIETSRRATKRSISRRS
jgi:hypothetical protein